MKQLLLAGKALACYTTLKLSLIHISLELTGQGFGPTAAAKAAAQGTPYSKSEVYKLSLIHILESVNSLIAVVKEPEIQQALIEVRDGLQKVMEMCIRDSSMAARPPWLSLKTRSFVTKGVLLYYHLPEMLAFTSRCV